VRGYRHVVITISGKESFEKGGGLGNDVRMGNEYFVCFLRRFEFSSRNLRPSFQKGGPAQGQVVFGRNSTSHEAHPCDPSYFKFHHNQTESILLSVCLKEPAPTTVFFPRIFIMCTAPALAIGLDFPGWLMHSSIVVKRRRSYG